MAISDESGGVLYRFVYDTYGELSDIKTDDGISLKNSEIVSDKTKDHTVEELAHAAGLTYLYNGQYGVATDQNGLYYMRARYYDQDIKRFINRDIVSGDIGNSKSLNRYAYVQGNPVSLTDPFGLCPDSNSSVRLVRTFLCDTDWSTVGHTALDIIGIFWDGADVINAFWYAAEGNTEMAIASAVYALPGIGMASGRLMMCSDKLYKAGKAVYRASKLTQGGYGVIAGLTMAGAGIGNIYNSLKNGEKISFKDIALAVGGTAIAIFSGKTLVSDMRQMLGISNKMDRTIKVGNADISHEPVPDVRTKAAQGINAGKSMVESGGVNYERISDYEFYMYLAERVDVSTPPNSAVFYSGKGNRELAEAFAEANGKTTLEMTEGGRFFDDLDLFGENSPLTKDQARNVWRTLSGRYAKAASGNTYGFVQGAYSKSIFNTVEYPNLVDNPNVTNIFTELMQ